MLCPFSFLIFNYIQCCILISIYFIICSANNCVPWFSWRLVPNFLPRFILYYWFPSYFMYQISCDFCLLIASAVCLLHAFRPSIIQFCLAQYLEVNLLYDFYIIPFFIYFFICISVKHHAKNTFNFSFLPFAHST